MLTPRMRSLIGIIIEIIVIHSIWWFDTFGHQNGKGIFKKCAKYFEPIWCSFETIQIEELFGRLNIYEENKVIRTAIDLLE